MLNSKPPAPGGSAANNSSSNHAQKHMSHTDDHMTRKESQSAEPGSYRRHSEVFVESNPIYFNPYHTIMPIPTSTQRPTNFLPFQPQQQQQQQQLIVGQQQNQMTFQPPSFAGGITPSSAQTPTNLPLTPSAINNNNNATNNDYFNKFNHLSFYQKLHQGPTNVVTNPNRNIYVNPSSLYPPQLTPQPTNIIHPLTSNHFFPHSSSTASFFSLANNTNKPAATNPLDLYRRQQQQQQQINREQDILDDEFLSLFKPKTSTTNETKISNAVVEPIKPVANPNPSIVKSDSILNSSNLIDLDSMTDSEQLSKLSTFELFDPLLAAEREARKSIEATIQNKATATKERKSSELENNNQQASQTANENKNNESKSAETSSNKNKDKNESNHATKEGKHNKKKRRKQYDTGERNNSKLHRIEAFEVIDNYLLENEFERFSRELYKSISPNPQSSSSSTAPTDNDTATALVNLITYNPILDYSPYLNKNIDIKITVRYKSNSPDAKMQITYLLVSIKAPIETILYNVLTIFNLEDLDINKYLLKIHGLEEYIQTSSMLGELKYINDCFNESVDPVFVLIQKSLVNVELSRRSNSDASKKPSQSNLVPRRTGDIDNKLFGDNYEYNLHQLTSRSKLESLTKAIIQNRTLVEEAVDEAIKNSTNTATSIDQLNQQDKLHNWLINFKEKLRAFQTLVFGVSYELFDLLLRSLDSVEKKLAAFAKRKQLNERQPLIMSTISKDHYEFKEYDYRIDSSSTSTSNGTSTENYETSHLYPSIVDIVNSSMHAVLLFVNCAAASFYWPYRLRPVYSDPLLNDDEIERELEIKDGLAEEDVIDVIQCEEKLAIYFFGLSRLNALINSLSTVLSPSTELYLKFSIVYGTRQMDAAYIRLDKFERLLNRKSDSIIKKVKVHFKHTDLCLLPRESCLFIQLFASTGSSLETSPNSGSSGYNDQNAKSRKDSYVPITNSPNQSFSEIVTNDRCLAWTSKSIFNNDLILENDEYLLCMFEGEAPQICTSASNIFKIDSPVIQISFPKYELVFKYPLLNLKCSCVLKEFEKLPVDVKERLLYICQKSVISNRISEDERDLIAKYYVYLDKIQNALAKIYVSLPSYDFSSIINFYAYLDQLSPLNLSESLELLLPYFPDAKLRAHAVKSIKINSPDVISLYLPQLLEALKYDRSHYSELAFMLIELSSKNIRFAHKLYWLLREYRSRKNSDCILPRYNLLYRALSDIFNQSMLEEIKQEVFLTERLDQIAVRIKELKNGEILSDELDMLFKDWSINKANSGSFRLPYNITFCAKEIDIKACSVISSFTMPLKLVFKNFDPTANSFYSIYKVGDDLRQDIFVLQLINIMNQLWLIEGLDLKVLTYTCLQTGEKRGFIEMITNAETLKEIQKGDFLNAFKKSCINDWLRFHNPKLGKFRLAVDNFTKSCAAYSLATYILGIGDRHNDNVMVKYTGHMFHIDFGKYLGDAQTFAGFKRDRTPILFTSDMFYVINQDKEPGARFQEFIEICCNAFQILRKNHQLLLSLIQLMINNNIPGLNQNAIQFVYKNLMIDLNEDDSSNAFKKLVHESLSKISSINFAIHTLAQPKTLSSTNYFSFITHIYNCETDSKITNIQLEKREIINSIEIFKCLVTRENECESNEVYRTFDEFCELYTLLHKTYPTLKLIETPSLSKFKDPKHIPRRFNLVNLLLKDISRLQAEINQSDIIYTFFHPILRDQTQETYFGNDDELITIDLKDDLTKKLSINDSYMSDIKGQVKVKLKYKDGKFYVNCLQCRNLKSPSNQPVSTLKPYVKCYLRPDPNKYTKKKVHPLYYGANPIFSDTIEYDFSLAELKNRTLELSVLNYKINVKEKIGRIEISLFELKNNSEFVRWFDLR